MVQISMRYCTTELIFKNQEKNVIAFWIILYEIYQASSKETVINKFNYSRVLFTYVSTRY